MGNKRRGHISFNRIWKGRIFLQTSICSLLQKNMIQQTKDNLEVFCSKIDKNTIVSGYEEKINEKLANEMPKEWRLQERGLVIFTIKKELIKFEELENFVDIDEKLKNDPSANTIFLENSIDYNSGEMRIEFDWFLRKN